MEGDMMPLKGLYLVVGLALLSGCGSSRPTSPPENLACNLSNYQVRDVYDEIHVYFRTLQTPEINVLELSAGGEFGAYGAGYLAGWKSIGRNANPIAREDIQIVTGVSTGALMATYAFLSTYDTTKNWDEELVQFYLQLKDAKIYSKRYLSLIWANSLFDTAGKTTLLQNINSELVERVRGAPLNRGLYVGIANLDSSEFVRIDMKKLANGNFENEAQRVGCYKAVIDAATAVEVVFPPVFIDGHMMGDGGVRPHVFLVFPHQASPNSDISKIPFSSFSLRSGNLLVTHLPNS